MLFRRPPHPVEAEIPRLRRFALALTRDREAADDLVQDCLARALAAWATRRGDDTALRPWLFAILHNRWRTRLRRDWTRPDRIPLDDANEQAAQISGGQSETLELHDLGAAMAKLSEEQRAVLLLVGVEGLSYEEAARVQNVPIGTVMSRLARARDHLRSLMDAEPPQASESGGRAHLRRVK